MNIVEKYYWIIEHPKYVPFGDTAVIEITPHMVCPETNCVEKLELLNTKLQFWVELLIPFFDEQHKQHCHSHDWELDCGGDTWEEAVENLYKLVLEKYGDYTQEDLDKQREEAMKDFDMDKWVKTVDSMMADNKESSEVVMLPDYEIEHMKFEIGHLEVLQEVLQNKLREPTITMQEYDDVQLELICVDHDLYVMRESVKCGYDVEKYGLRNED
ncbi:hypothetical protein GAP32_133 [Cronobacter phage vB_CsaM_GAP32]|uniref:Uncharacterized protein n=1 Tax=Cronobacter phage vB_CsaM_GAP32 TaxID=1141136 RepID=K4F6L4_9CAUD|nr:hypothetical protein GAP32_133 [Cronobacter phage vB_CsaM_GAP32]AFC21583.1 hypothetical protein GAP32_133 [Cronobacter phage vB_CsaM_GAP32]